MSSLINFLDSKPLYYDEIDYSRFPRIYSKIKGHFKEPKTIHIVGTNGKGTTGRFLATALFENGFKVGHYTSPHILKFNERIWIDAKEISDDALEFFHKELKGILEKDDLESLSYFEYTTLLAMKAFSECDYVVLEAGLGGEHDATAVFKKTLTLVTPIDLDHQAFLGDDITEIAQTKLNAIQNNAILAKQKHSEVYDLAFNLDGVDVKKVDSLLSKDDFDKINHISKNLSLASYLKENLALAISALNFLNINYSEDQFDSARLFGRLSYIAKNIIIDVGHNPLAASSIVKELNGKKYVLIYNSYKDKDYKTILSILKPIIKRVQIIPIESQRAENIGSLHKSLNDLKIEYSKFCGVHTNESYLVFGSFSVVEQFLKEYK